MFNYKDVLETIDMIEREHLDIRTVYTIPYARRLKISSKSPANFRVNTAYQS